MKRITAFVAAVLATIVMVNAVSARDVPGDKVAAEAKRTAASETKKNNAVRKAKQAKSGSDGVDAGGNRQDVPGKLASESRKQHDTARKTIDNMK